MEDAAAAPATTAPRFDGETDDLEDIEVKLLLQGMHLRYGYDFRDYSPASMRRGLHGAMAREGLPTISAYQERILRDSACMQRFLATVGVTATGMFREPELMSCVRDEVAPLLRTYPSVRVWIAGCASGEEAYSIAIVLREEDVLRRTVVYATDINERLLAVGRLASYPADRYRRYAEAYLAAGGRGRLSDHCTVDGSTIKFDPAIASSITWARHNLATDGSFNDFHLIVCANVLVYFGRALQERSHRLFYDSLVRSGFLAIGRRESLLNCPDRDQYEQVRDGANLFRKTRW